MVFISPHEIRGVGGKTPAAQQDCLIKTLHPVYKVRCFHVGSHPERCVVDEDKQRVGSVREYSIRFLEIKPCVCSTCRAIAPHSEWECKLSPGYKSRGVSILLEWPSIKRISPHFLYSTGSDLTGEKKIGGYVVCGSRCIRFRHTRVDLIISGPQFNNNPFAGYTYT
jgi:hypothetical protein